MPPGTETPNCPRSLRRKNGVTNVHRKSSESTSSSRPEHPQSMGDGRNRRSRGSLRAPAAGSHRCGGAAARVRGSIVSLHRRLPSRGHVPARPAGQRRGHRRAVPGRGRRRRRADRDAGCGSRCAPRRHGLTRCAGLRRARHRRCGQCRPVARAAARRVGSGCGVLVGAGPHRSACAAALGDLHAAPDRGRPWSPRVRHRHRAGHQPPGVRRARREQHRHRRRR